MPVTKRWLGGRTGRGAVDVGWGAGGRGGRGAFERGEMHEDLSEELGWEAGDCGELVELVLH